MNDFAIEVNQLTKIYGLRAVVDGINLKVPNGIVFGFLGPNGAGKTTSLEMMEGLRQPSSGDILIKGLNTRTHLRQIKEIIGVQLQSSVLDERIKVGEVIELFASFYKKSLSLDILLELTNLQDKKNEFQRKLSGGQKQRLALALCLVNDPEIIFLDEPTTGLDPQSRRNLWDIISMLKKKGKTIILTTHYMDEAEKLCDHLAIIDQGKIIATGSPNQLIEKLNIGRVIELPANNKQFEILKCLQNKSKIEFHADVAEIHTNQIVLCMDEILKQRELLNIDNLHIRKATLEDVFISLTGRTLRE